MSASAFNAAESLEITGTGNFKQAVQLFSTGILNPTDLRNGIFSANFSTGGAGNIVINTPKFIANNGAFVVTSTFGQGQGGNLILNARDSVELKASAIATGTGIGDAGKAGNLTINTAKLTASESGLVSTSTIGSGQGGTIAVNASDAIELIGQAIGNRVASLLRVLVLYPFALRMPLLYPTQLAQYVPYPKVLPLVLGRTIQL